MVKWKKLERANLEHSVNAQKKPPYSIKKTLSFNWMKWGKYYQDIGIIIFVFYPETVVRGAPEGVLKICSKFTRKHLYWDLFLMRQKRLS